MPEIPLTPNEQNRPAMDADLDSVKALFRSGDEAGAFPGFAKLAEQGSAPAMTWLGYMYLKGKGVGLDAHAALQWFSKAAALGDAEAMGWIAHMYFSGDGVATDIAAARHWYMKAAEAGDADGQHCLASMLSAAGEHVEAERWIQKAADQGYAPSVDWFRQQNAHKMLEEKRYDEALPVLRDAANSGSAWAHEWLGNMYWYGQGVPKDGDQSIRHYETAYDGGRQSVAYIIGGLHFKAGRPDVALAWWRKDRSKPISSLYWQYRVTKDHPELAAHPGEADELLKKAADAGHIPAKLDVARSMMRGRKDFGTRLEGVRAFVRVLPQMIRIIRHDEKDERLQ
jgi:TPR repeat protein